MVPWKTAFLLALVLTAPGCGGKRRSVAELQENLKSGNEAVRIGAADELREMSRSAAAEAVPALTQALQDQSPYVRAAAAKALGHIGPEARPAAAALRKAAQDKDDGVRIAATQALKAIGD
jgi:HEAT repeat protein